MHRSRSRRALAAGALLALTLGLASCSSPAVPADTQAPAEETSAADTANDPKDTTLTAPAPTPADKEPLTVTGVTAKRLSRQQMAVTWPDALDGQAKQYILKKRLAKDGTSVGEWTTVSTVDSDGQPGGADWTVTDQLDSDQIVQYEYAVETVPTDTATYAGETSTGVLASNLLVCIDPGHFAGKNYMDVADGYGYAEGDASLRIALKLCDILQDTYGISSCLTRDSGTITLDGYSNDTLDKAHLTLRGTYAGQVDSDLLLSLHTNANADNANGAPTCEQPLALNKPILLASNLTCASPEPLAAANAIGTNLALASYQAGTAAREDFTTVQLNNVPLWTEPYNDSVENPGTVFARRQSDGSDFYGVLRGATSVGVPAIIIEHGFHTVPEVRKAAMEGDLLDRWAAADAYGIAYGYGFESELVQPQ